MFYIKAKWFIKNLSFFHINWSKGLRNDFRLIRTTTQVGLFDLTQNLIIKDSPTTSQNQDHCIFIPINFIECWLKKNCLYIGREKEYIFYPNIKLVKTRLKLFLGSGCMYSFEIIFTDFPLKCKFLLRIYVGL